MRLRGHWLCRGVLYSICNYNWFSVSILSALLGEKFMCWTLFKLLCIDNLFSWTLITYVPTNMKLNIRDGLKQSAAGFFFKTAKGIMSNIFFKPTMHLGEWEEGTSSFSSALEAKNTFKFHWEVLLLYKVIQVWHKPDFHGLLFNPAWVVCLYHLQVYLLKYEHLETVLCNINPIN